MTKFSDFDLPEKLHTSLERVGFTQPTPIQTQAIPMVLEGKDVLGTAGTGTGKTGAFGIPLLAKLLSDPSAKAMIITPTRELATQVITELRKMTDRNAFHSALLIGGEPIVKQFKQINAKPRLIVGTPGRINDHLKRNKNFVQGMGYLVLDETDRMLDMGFSIQIEAILAYLNGPRQTLLFSATMPPYIEKMAQKYLQDPVRIHIKKDESQEDMSKITHEVIDVRKNEKRERLLEELDKRQGSIIIFVKTKGDTEDMAYKLSKAGHSAEAIHGDLRQHKREKIIRNFRSEKFRILVGTDIIARGLDIPHVRHVLNYDLPQCPEDYIHRIGRTARAGATGDAACFVTPSDHKKWNMIARLMAPKGEKPAYKQEKSSGGERRGKSFAKKGKPSFRGKAQTSERGKKYTPKKSAGAPVRLRKKRSSVSAS